MGFPFSSYDTGVDMIRTTSTRICLVKSSVLYVLFVGLLASNKTTVADETNLVIFFSVPIGGERGCFCFPAPMNDGSSLVQIVEYFTSVPCPEYDDVISSSVVYSSLITLLCVPVYSYLVVHAWREKRLNGLLPSFIHATENGIKILIITTRQRSGCTFDRYCFDFRFYRYILSI